MSTFYRINQQIHAKEVRLLRADGSQIGIVTLAEALSQAANTGVDAVEIAPQAVPPVVKLIDYKKFLYQLNKKERAIKAGVKKVDIKEIRLTPFMAENDLQTRLNQGRKFLGEGHKVKVTVKFVGRQLSHKEYGDITIRKAFDSLSDISVVEQTPKWLGRQYVASLSPIKKK